MLKESFVEAGEGNDVPCLTCQTTGHLEILEDNSGRNLSKGACAMFLKVVLSVKGLSSILGAEILLIVFLAVSSPLVA